MSPTKLVARALQTGLGGLAQTLSGCTRAVCSAAPGVSQSLGVAPPASGRPVEQESLQRESSGSEQRGFGETGRTHIVFLGCPGVGKGTYASRLGKLLRIPHISVGDLVREELKSSHPSSQKMREVMSQGKLLPDDFIVDVLSKRVQSGMQEGEHGFILDGFPRTTAQAEILSSVSHIDLVVNLRLREEILVEKCMGRRMCRECGGNFNVAGINLVNSDGHHVVMPPLSPPSGCEDKMTVRADDTEDVIRNRLAVYHAESKPVEDYYRRKKLLVDFDILGGIPETWPRLLSTLGVQKRVGGKVAIQ